MKNMDTEHKNQRKMPNFLEFIEEQAKSAPQQVSSDQKKAIAQISSEVDGLSLSSSKAAQFATEVTAVAHSSEFLQPVSDAVGTPKQDESEDEFVARGKAAIVAQLRKTFKLK